MNLRAFANGVTSAINPNLIGVLKQSTGYGYVGDATFTGSISDTVLTVTEMRRGALAIGSIIAGPEVASGTAVTGFLSGACGETGTYTIAPAQTVLSGPLSATGDGERVPLYSTTYRVPMQFQALSSDELRQLDALNISTTMRAVHMNGDLQGIARPGVRGGDILLAPTGLTGQRLDTWLVTQVMEAFDASGWCRIAVTLQQDKQYQ